MSSHPPTLLYGRTAGGENVPVRVDDTGLLAGGGNPFDQNLNTDDDVTFASVTAGGVAYPVADGTSGQVLTTDGAGHATFEDPTGGGGTPGSPDQSIQYNNAGAFAGVGTWDGTTFQIPGSSAFSDLAVGATLGPELVTNYNFNGDASGWTLGSGWTYTGNSVTDDYISFSFLFQALTLTPGATYRIAIDHDATLDQDVTFYGAFRVMGTAGGDGRRISYVYAIARDPAINGADNGVGLRSWGPPGIIYSVSVREVLLTSPLNGLTMRVTPQMDGTGRVLLAGTIGDGSVRNFFDPTYNPLAVLNPGEPITLEQVRTAVLAGGEGGFSGAVVSADQAYGDESRYYGYIAPPNLDNAGTTVGLAGAGAGNLSAGTYYYAIAYLAKDSSDAAAVTGYYQNLGPLVVTDPSTDGQALLSNLPAATAAQIAAGVITGMRIMRTPVDVDPTSYIPDGLIGSYANYKTVEDIAADATSYQDNTADGSLGADGVFTGNPTGRLNRRTTPTGFQTGLNLDTTEPAIDSDFVTNVTAFPAMRVTPRAVVELPSGALGMIAAVNDALTPVVGVAVSNGGAAYALVQFGSGGWTVLGV